MRVGPSEMAGQDPPLALTAGENILGGEGHSPVGNVRGEYVRGINVQGGISYTRDHNFTGAMGRVSLLEITRPMERIQQQTVVRWRRPSTLKLNRSLSSCLQRLQAIARPSTLLDLSDVVNRSLNCMSHSRSGRPSTGVTSLISES